jgi:hypothetical protein
MRARRESVVLGRAQFSSYPFSNVWSLSTRDDELARFRRVPSRHITRGIIEGTNIEMRPEGWGTVVIVDEARELGRIERRSWWGRRWNISGSGFAAELISEPLPRRWTLRLGNQPIAYLAGSAISYNRIRVSADLLVPTWALALAWQVIARPWEAAAAPRVLRVRPAPQA